MSAGGQKMMAHVEAMARSVRSEAPPGYAERLGRLEALEGMVLHNKDRITGAIDSDFAVDGGGGGRGEAYCVLGDVWAGLNTLREVKNNFKQWMAPERVRLGFNRFPFNLMGDAEIHTKPLGLVLIICPWNFPFHIPVSAMADVLAAGNRVVIKPSEFTPLASSLLQELVAEHFDPNWVTVYTGGVEVATQLTAYGGWDHIFFVGSTRVGQKVMAAAAENLIPVTLELGGKNPCIVAPDYDLRQTAEVIAKANQENAGQICTTLDTVFCPTGTAQELVRHMRELYAVRWGAGRPIAEHGQCCSLIHAGHYGRAVRMLRDAESGGAEVVSLDPTGCSEYADAVSHNRLPPHAILNPGPDAICSREELFGPIMVVREVASLQEAIDYINTHDEPLACYAFTSDAATRELLQSRVRCGGMCINAINLHTVVAALPFGGMGKSGTGCYHGKEGFLNFSHRMSSYEYKRAILPNIHLPFTDNDVKTIESYCKPPPDLELILRGLCVAGLGGVVTYLARAPWFKAAMLCVLKAAVRALENA